MGSWADPIPSRDRCPALALVEFLDGHGEAVWQLDVGQLAHDMNYGRDETSTYAAGTIPVAGPE